MNLYNKYIYTTLFALFALGLKAQQINSNQDSIQLKYPFSYYQKGPLFLGNTAKKTIVYDEVLKRYIVKETIGDYSVETPLFMTDSEYSDYRLKQDMRGYYVEKINSLNANKKGSKESRRNLLPTYYINSSLFRSIFGGNTIKVNTKGAIDVRLGGSYQYIENPQLSEENRSNFNFDFDQQITASITASIGERLKINANYDTKSTFDFQNMVKIEFTPTEDDIIKKIDVGNVNMTSSNNLIAGSQSLFGVKTELQFGDTRVTGVFSQQRSQTKTVTAEGGSTLNEFELQASQYEYSRHFFLAHYFRNNYNEALSNMPLINSPINIIKLEVWITNRATNDTDVRNIVALTDLAEYGTDLYDDSLSNISNANVLQNGPQSLPSNEVNSLGSLFTESSPVRDFGTVTAALSPYNMEQGTDYTVLENARKLDENEYTYHPQLGVLSLKRQLTDGDVLAVAFQYTVSGDENVYRVGELSTDGIPAESNLLVKMLRSELIQPNTRIWDLMMKNIYSIGAYQLNPQGFRLDLMYRDDQTGVPVNILQNAVTPGANDKTLLNLFNLDVLDQNNLRKEEGDGYFDYVEGLTVKSDNGSILFPYVEPFGRDLERLLTSAEDEQYLFNELYQSTQAQAQNNYQSKDKFLLKGYYKSDTNNGISLGAFNVPRGSVKVTANGNILTEGVDYVVDYMSGRVQVINPSLQASQSQIQVSVENNTIFNQQSKRFMGLDIEHKFSDNLVMSGTFLNVNERPLTPKVTFGQDPINNTMFGLSLNYNGEAPFLTKLVNKLPNVDTDVKSQIAVRADMAYLLPGTPSGIDINGQATTYLDDFEGSQIPINLMDQQSWKLSSTPLSFSEAASEYDFGGELTEDLEYGKKRAKLAWYSIDRLFYGASSLTPSNIDNIEISRAEVSRVEYGEIFPNTNLDLTQTNTIRTFDMAYYPSERGSYNFETDLTLDGLLKQPEENWGGITRPLNTTDFDRANVEYIQFWLQDPYDHYSITQEEGLPVGVNPQDINNQQGALYINLGNISEDILKDNRKMYENGLPAFNEEDNTDETAWGKIPNNKSYIYTFSETDQDRLLQDVGLDGLTDEEEKLKYPQFANLDDPAADNYQFFRGSNLDQSDASILKRYKDFNNTQGNSPTSGLSTESYPTTATTIPDVEDINRDQTMNTINAYYQYKVSLNRSDLQLGQNYIVDVKTVNRANPAGGSKQITWYQFRIPINTGTAIGPISDFHSIRFMRMFMTQFKMPVVLRFAQLQLVRGDWRRYNKNPHGGVITETDNLSDNDLQNFSVGVVNIEENESRSPVPYVLPPGIVREQLQGSTIVQQQNEQSLSLKVKELEQGETRAVFKNLVSDIRMFKELRMYIHAEEIAGTSSALEDGKMTAIMRLGSDFTDNFYQIELPLKKTPFNTFNPDEIWPAENQLKVDLQALGQLKLERYQNFGSSFNTELYPKPVDGEAPAYRIRVKGNPNLSNIRSVMLGVKNTDVNALPQSAELWFNEMRLAGFDNKGGWATVVSANANLADVADVAVNGRIQTIGFGSVEQRVNERSQEEIKQYGVTTNVKIGKLLPKKWGVQLPLSYSIAEEFKDPKFDMQYQDVLYQDARQYNENSGSSTDYTKRKSINFINVRKNRNPESKKIPMPYDIENFSVSYSYNENFHKDYNVQKHIMQDVRASASYTYGMKPITVSPLKNIGFFKNSKYFKLLSDFHFNILPKSIGVNTNIIRNYSEQLNRNLVPGLPELPTLKQRNFLFDWDYNINYDVSKSLNVTFRAANKYIYDGFEETDEADQITLFSNFFNTGRPSQYAQSLNANYKLPLDKLPFMNGLVTSNYSYAANFNWAAGSQSYVEQIGNAIQNSNTHNLTGSFNFTRLYRNIKLDKLFLTKRVKTGQEVIKRPGKKDKIKKNYTRKPLDKKKISYKILKGAYDLISSVKNVKVSYAENNGTQLAGYRPSIGFLGRDQYNGGLAPSIGFVFGSQKDIREMALLNQWLITRNVNYGGAQEDDPYYNRTYAQTHYNKLDFNVSVKPIRDLDINIQANRTFTKNTSQQLDPQVDLNGTVNPDDDITQFGFTQLAEMGNFSTTFNMIATAFDGNGDETFIKFLDYRTSIAQRWASSKGLSTIEGYGLNSQQVLIPAFRAAYSGKSVQNEKLGVFGKIPLPNWRVTYRGLMKNKWIKKNFSSFTLSHGYNSTYVVGNYTNNIQYKPDAITQLPGKDDFGNYFSEYLISNISLTDAFSPLIKVDMKLKNTINITGAINRDRTLSMNLNNNTLSDIRGSELVVGLGYQIKNLKIYTNFGGKKREIKSNLNLKADLSLRKNITTIRNIETANNQVTGGQNITGVKFSADYNLNKNLLGMIYFDYNASRYAISTSFPRQAINAGISLTYNLGN